MPIQPFESSCPQILGNAFVDPTAVVIGDVFIDQDSSVWPCAVIRGDVNVIRIGKRSSIQDGAIVHVTHDSKFYPGGFATTIGDDVTVGHQVVLHGCHLEGKSLIGMGSIVLDGARIEETVILAAGSTVTPKQVLESGFLWLGTPAKKIRLLSPEEIEFISYSAQHYVRLKDKYLQKITSEKA